VPQDEVCGVRGMHHANYALHGIDNGENSKGSPAHSYIPYDLILVFG
jgi:hypothetical protein